MMSRCNITWEIFISNFLFWKPRGNFQSKVKSHVLHKNEQVLKYFQHKIWRSLEIWVKRRYRILIVEISTGENSKMTFAENNAHMRQEQQPLEGEGETGGERQPSEVEMVHTWFRSVLNAVSEECKFVGCEELVTAILFCLVCNKQLLITIDDNLYNKNNTVSSSNSTSSYFEDELHEDENGTSNDKKPRQPSVEMIECVETIVKYVFGMALKSNDLFQCCKSSEHLMEAFLDDINQLNLINNPANTGSSNISNNPQPPQQRRGVSEVISGLGTQVVRDESGSVRYSKNNNGRGSTSIATNATPFSGANLNVVNNQGSSSSSSSTYLPPHQRKRAADAVLIHASPDDRLPACIDLLQRCIDVLSKRRVILGGSSKGGGGAKRDGFQYPLPPQHLLILIVPAAAARFMTPPLANQFLYQLQIPSTAISAQQLPPTLIHHKQPKITPSYPLVEQADIQLTRDIVANQVHLSLFVERYIYDTCLALRRHPSVCTGPSAACTLDLKLVSKLCAAIVFGMDYVVVSGSSSGTVGDQVVDVVFPSVCAHRLKFKPYFGDMRYDPGKCDRQKLNDIIQYVLSSAVPKHF